MEGTLFCVFAVERNETSLKGRSDYPKDLTAEESERSNHCSNSTLREQRTQLSDQSAFKTKDHFESNNITCILAVPRPVL